ncbi:M48 family metallopeptidase [Rhodanobacter sp. AS-Z3]|uniref:M48 family metallopeptidase n=1 Tax=Rhodanobacter sp. AS-Z3 TaxID=3031330 RepID=UPI002478D77A|nr:M48 family metallopeptidase [Rhodanobacter sp. AS-Z3]WEN14922.1 M48 family metallopeptidase [Rhodanobacter sp. AS-Z3]
MDFFAQQARVRGSSRRLVALFALAVVAIVAAIDFVVWFTMGHHSVDGEPVASNLPLLFGSSAAIVAGIGLSSMFRIMSLSGGGKTVAESVGAVLVPTDTRDPQLRQLRNVIEEVAIAAGVPVPDIYLMQEESGINAFAAGYSASDAAVCVTQGCLDQLSRDELQGVIAHEFSHVLNGDMRLNIRLMGLLFGILVLAIVGRRVIWFGGGRDSRRGGGNVALIGLALIVVGYIGYFFARLIQAAVSRSRESLADASAVQFTRQTDGIAGALKKIAVLSEGSRLQVANKQEVAHMLFGEAGKFNALFATHPPLIDRIRALEPGFREEELVRLGVAMQRAAMQPVTSPPAAPAPMRGGAIPGMVVPSVLPAVLTGAMAAGGVANTAQFQRAAAVHQSMPESLKQAVQQPESALAVVLALAASAAQPMPSQRRIIADAFGDDVQQAVQSFTGELRALAPMARLPLVSLAFPALKQLPTGRQQVLLATLDAVVNADGKVDLNEYCLARLVRLQLLEAQQPRRAPVDGVKKLPACRASVTLVCAIVAAGGCSDEANARRAWLVAMQNAFPGEAMNWVPPPAAWQPPFERALDDLDGLLPIAKELVIQSLLLAIRADGQVSVEEAELLRVICASLHCAVPPTSAGELGSEGVK